MGPLDAELCSNVSGRYREHALFNNFYIDISIRIQIAGTTQRYCAAGVQRNVFDMP